MLRVVFDTNIVISGTLWTGTPYLVLQAAAKGEVKALVSEAMLDEMKDVIERPKFAGRLMLIHRTGAEVVRDYAAIAEIVDVNVVEAIITADSDDDQVLACAVSGHADYIVSGDPHLLEVKQVKNIPILTASDFLTLLAHE